MQHACNCFSNSAVHTMPKLMTNRLLTFFPFATTAIPFPVCLGTAESHRMR